MDNGEHQTGSEELFKRFLAEIFQRILLRFWESSRILNWTLSGESSKQWSSSNRYFWLLQNVVTGRVHIAQILGRTGRGRLEICRTHLIRFAMSRCSARSSNRSLARWAPCLTQAFEQWCSGRRAGPWTNCPIETGWPTADRRWCAVVPDCWTCAGSRPKRRQSHRSSLDGGEKEGREKKERYLIKS